jgi:hypothetical protein
MKRFVCAVTMVVTLGGCGKKADDAQNAVSAVVAAAGASGKMEAGLKDAERFQQERVAKGDTLAMPYAELQKFLPESIDGYTARGAPSGSSQAMAGFSMSQTEQTWVAEPGADGATPEIKVSLVDFGGTQQGYAMMAAPLMMGFSQEDDRRRMGSTKVDVPHTGAWEEFNKENKDAKITAVARYRFVISVEARNKGEDQSAKVKGLAEEIARKFDGK